jgi:hypothetical protein
MGDSQADGGGGAERPVSRFDPVAGMRAVADIQAEGLRAAGELLERVLGSEPDRPAGRSRSPAGDYGALVDAWTELLRRTIDGLAPPPRPGPITVPIDATGAGPELRLAVGEPSGAGAAAEIWLHNPTFAAVGPLVLRCGELSDAGGTMLAGAEVRFDPPELALLEARSSRAVVVSLAATGPLRAGTYRGTIQAGGAPRLWLPLEVAVEPC